MRVGLLTREYPPEVYGGAGVHAEHLVRHLRGLVDVEVHCFGSPRPDAIAHAVPESLRRANFAVQALGVDVDMAADLGAVDVVHSHTWYANYAGHLAGLLQGVPHVLTAHSLEPRRPWKRQQLGTGYDVSRWAERTAYESAAAVIAVSDGMRDDVLAVYPFLDPEHVHVVRNGIDTDAFVPDPNTDVLLRHGIDPAQPYVLFVGRITPQKGMSHLLRAAADLTTDAQVVLVANAPDTPELGRQVTAEVRRLQQQRDHVHWLPEALPRHDLVQLLTHATVFACPSVYEPMGLVNLEAMACGTPVVASAVGGIPEVVDDGVTGCLVEYDPDPGVFETNLAKELNALLTDADLARNMGVAGRARAIESFGWDAVAAQTVAVYQSVLS
jgi:starch synthase